jgi:transcription initiation factor IIE alpha subunit
MHHCEEGHEPIAFVEDIPETLATSAFCPMCQLKLRVEYLEETLNGYRNEVDELKQELADEKSKKTV